MSRPAAYWGVALVLALVAVSAVVALAVGDKQASRRWAAPHRSDYDVARRLRLRGFDAPATHRPRGAARAVR